MCKASQGLLQLVEEVNKVLVMDMVMEGLVDKEVAKLMEEVNKVMVKTCSASLSTGTLNSSVTSV